MVGLRAVGREYVCDGAIEVTLVAVAHGEFGDEPITLGPGTKVDAPCEQTIDVDDERVDTQPVAGGQATWVCPRCSKSNWRLTDA